MFKIKAFTLVELLVVIAIIGLLSTIVLVSTSGLREQAEIAKTLTWAKSVDSLLGVNAVGIWSLDEPATQGATIFDLSGWGNNGTLVTNDGSTDKSTEGIINGAITFDGVDDYVGVNGTRYNNFTITYWAKCNNFSGSEYEVISDDSAQVRLGFTIDKSFAARWRFADGLYGTLYGSASGQIEENRWYHYAFSYDKATEQMEFFVNGEMTNEETVDWYYNGAGIYNIGRNQTNNKYFNGLIDEVRIYNTVLTASEIQSNYYAGLDRLFVKGLMDKCEYQQGLTLK
jgi:prepilin-type N-terminal cleavage/methylation domain-containing protein